MPDRLIVEMLESVGLVEAGANGPAQIMITKRKDAAKPDVEKIVGDPFVVAAGISGVSAYDPATGDISVTLSTDDGFEKARNFAEFTEARIHSDFSVFADGMFGDGYLTQDERIGLSKAIGEALKSFRASLSESHPELFERDPFAGTDVELGELVETIEASNFSVAADGGATLTLSNTKTSTTASAPPTIVINNPTTSTAADVAAAIAAATTAEESTEGSLVLDESENDEGGGEMPTPTLSEEARKALDEDASAYVAHLEAEVAKANEEPAVDEVDDLEKSLEGVPATVAEAIRKRDAEQAERIEAAEAKAQESETVALAEREIRLAKEYIAKAETMPNFAPRDEFAPILRKVETGVALSDEEAATLVGWMKTADALVKDSKFFNEFGGDHFADGSSAMAIINKRAAELRLEEPSLSLDQAAARVMDADRELAARADAEERERSAGRS
jgi:hypothetical protein